MKIMVFLHGTVIMHRGGLGHSREDRVRQILEGEQSTRDFSSYVPIGNSAQKLQSWQAQGAEIAYLSSHRKVDDVEKDKSVLRQHQFPDGEIYYRQPHDGYSDVAEKIMPDILIEDDCESIGGTKEMTYPHISEEVRRRITHVLVREFQGIDHLPDDIEAFKAGLPR
jgi:hypothetical protein